MKSTNEKKGNGQVYYFLYLTKSYLQNTVKGKIHKIRFNDIVSDVRDP